MLWCGSGGLWCEADDPVRVVKDALVYAIEAVTAGLWCGTNEGPIGFSHRTGIHPLILTVYHQVVVAGFGTGLSVALFETY